MGRMKLGTAVERLRVVDNSEHPQGVLKALSRISPEEVKQNTAHAKEYVSVLWRCFKTLQKSRAFSAASVVAEFIHTASMVSDPWLIAVGDCVLPSLFSQYQEILASFQLLCRSSTNSGKLSLIVSAELQKDPDALHLLASILDLCIDCCDLEGEASSTHLFSFVRATSAVLIGSTFSPDEGKSLEKAYACDVLRRNASYCLTNIFEAVSGCRDGAARLLRSRTSKLMHAIATATEISVQRSLIRLVRMLYLHALENNAFSQFSKDVDSHLLSIDSACQSSSQSLKSVKLFAGIDLSSVSASDQVEQFRTFFHENQVIQAAENAKNIWVTSCFAYSVQSLQSEFSGASRAIIDWNQRSFSLKRGGTGFQPEYVPYYHVRTLCESSDFREIRFIRTRGKGDDIVLYLSSESERNHFKMVVLPVIQGKSPLKIVSGERDARHSVEIHGKGSHRKTSVVSVSIEDGHFSQSVHDPTSETQNHDGSKDIESAEESRLETSAFQTADLEANNCSEIPMLGIPIESVFQGINVENVLLPSHSVDNKAESQSKIACTDISQDGVSQDQSLNLTSLASGSDNRMSVSTFPNEENFERPEMIESGEPVSQSDRDAPKVHNLPPKKLKGGARLKNRQSANFFQPKQEPEIDSQTERKVMQGTSSRARGSHDASQSLAAQNALQYTASAGAKTRQNTSHWSGSHTSPCRRKHRRIRSDLSRTCSIGSARNVAQSAEHQATIMPGRSNPRTLQKHPANGPQRRSPNLAEEPQLSCQSSESYDSLREISQGDSSHTRTVSKLCQMPSHVLLSLSESQNNSKYADGIRVKQAANETKLVTDVKNSVVQTPSISKTSEEVEDLASKRVHSRFSDVSTHSSKSNAVHEDTNEPGHESDVLEKLLCIIRATLSARTARSEMLKAAAKSEIKRIRAHVRRKETASLSCSRKKLANLALDHKKHLALQLEKLKAETGACEDNLESLRSTCVTFAQEVGTFENANKRRSDILTQHLKKRQKLLLECGKKEISVGKNKLCKSSREDELVSGISKLLGQAL